MDEPVTSAGAVALSAWHAAVSKLLGGPRKACRRRKRRKRAEGPHKASWVGAALCAWAAAERAERAGLRAGAGRYLFPFWLVRVRWLLGQTQCSASLCCIQSRPAGMQSFGSGGIFIMALKAGSAVAKSSHSNAALINPVQNHRSRPFFRAHALRGETDGRFGSGLVGWMWIYFK
jgi:hypothetical protein